ISADGYQTFHESLDLRGKKKEELHAELAPVKGRGLLRVTSTSVGAIVRVDDQVLGAVPAEVSLAKGPHRVRLEHPDYQMLDTTVELGLGETKTVDLTMQQKPGLLSKWWFWTAAGAVVVGGITAGVLGELSARPPSAVTKNCSTPSGEIGTIAVIPSAGDSDDFALEVVTGVGAKTAAECVATGYKGGCIVARRALRFIPEQNL